MKMNLAFNATALLSPLTSIGRYSFHWSRPAKCGNWAMCPPELATIMAGATALVYPSVYEGFGLPPLEAMACGVPVICANTSSLPEVVGDAGVLIDPRDEGAFAYAMRRMAEDPAAGAGKSYGAEYTQTVPRL